jgi:ribosomal protein S18 acetylase RimI-like enzyme
MKVRHLNSSDVSALLQLRISTSESGTMGQPDEVALSLTLPKIEEQLRPPFETFGIFVNQILVGAATVFKLPDEPSENWYGLSNVVIAEAFRRRGFARLLVETCINQATRIGATGVTLDVYVPNPAAVSLYELLGFKHGYTEKAAYLFEGQQFDRISMHWTPSGVA